MIGERIKELRTKKGITQRELADYLNLTPKMISFYEREERFPPHDIIIKLSEYFNVSTDYLLGQFNMKKLLQMTIEKLENKEEVHPLEPSLEITITDMVRKKTTESILDLFSLLPNSGYMPIPGNTKMPAEDAMKYILKQPALVNYGGYDLETMSDKEMADLVNDLLYALKLSVGRQKREKEQQEK